MLGTIPAGQSPGALRFSPVDPGEIPNLLLVVDEGSADLSFIRTRTNSLITVVQVGDHPKDLAVKLFKQ